MSERTYYDGKYTVKARTDGGLEFLRYGEAWPAADDLRFNNLVGVMFREQLEADATIADLRAILRRMEDAERVCEKATRWWDTATVAHDAGVEYRVKGDAESRLRAVAADAAHADTIVGLGEAIEAYRATQTKEPRDEKAE